jgi:hypothetical protein
MTKPIRGFSESLLSRSALGGGEYLERTSRIIDSYVQLLTVFKRLVRCSLGVIGGGATFFSLQKRMPEIKRNSETIKWSIFTGTDFKSGIEYYQISVQ